ncbi:MAG: formylglycine-generating enzyme family protein [Treponema sp.]|nr:formylglycine-generating enzyme family protein [Treponema sp.]
MTKFIKLFGIVLLSVVIIFSLTAQDDVRRQREAAGFVFIEGGTFQMGSPSREAERVTTEGPQHRVTVSSFYMGQFPVTQREYREVMRTNPSNFRGDNLPVENVNWFDAIEYCNRRSQREGLTPAYTITGRGHERTVTWNRDANGYRLPTEAEWEYACRAGTTTAFNTGNNITANQANINGLYPYNNNAAGINRGTTTPMGTFPANRWGLYDMHGNVYEWCWDWFIGYTSTAKTNPIGPPEGVERVLRGGTWAMGANFARSAYRQSGYDDYKSEYIGFRVVLP